MGFLNWLFGTERSESAEKKDEHVSRQGSWLHIGTDFFGQYQMSANGRYTLGWVDSFTEVTANGRSKNISGKYVLLDGDRLITQGTMPRPNDGHVADNGTFVLCDWMNTTELRGTFRVIDASGESLISHLFHANLYRCGISPDGRFAVCQTCNADSPDGGKLSFFDVNARRLLWKKDPETGWADDYRFDTVEGKVYSVHKTKGAFAYDFKGEFVDIEKYRTALLEKGNPWEVVATVRTIIEASGDAIAESETTRLLAILNQARERSEASRPEERAQLERAIAEIHDTRGNSIDALRYYDAALALNPKVGVKRRAEALRKQIATEGKNKV